MSEEVIKDEVQPELVENTQVEETIDEQPEQQEEVRSEDTNNTFQDNIKNLRESKEREAQRALKAEYERDQLIKYFETMKQQANGQPVQEPNELDIKDDEYIDGKHLNKVTKQIQNMQNELHQWKQYSEETTAELKLNNEFSDFNSVVTAENVKEFIKRYPEMRSIVQNNDTLYNRGKGTYKAIKKFMGDNLKSNINKSQQTKIQNNSIKPRPTSSIQEQQNSPLSKANLFANGYNEDIGKALEDEMYDAISRY